MEIRELAYQQRVLKLLDDYLDELVRQKAKADKIEDANAREEDPDLQRKPWDFPLETWAALKDKNKLPLTRSEIPYSDRQDGTSRPVPNIVYKVPTAGGKTYLAVSSLSKIFNKYLGRCTGFVLWIVPNEAIYAQIKKQLSDRRHPYRQLLDNLSGNAVKLMEKTTPLHARDVESNLCIMLLMLQSSSREVKKALKIFQDRGDIHGFTPEEGNQLAHKKAIEDVPNLDVIQDLTSGYSWMPVMDSLGNALRITRPVVVMDEGHKAVTALAFKTLYDFNPSFVLELTATPKDVKARAGKNPCPARYQNLLAEVSGIELDREGMIKIPLNVDSRQSPDWKTTLNASLDRLNTLSRQAQDFYSNTDRYIRPIMLVQVERTGSEQRNSKYIHAEDVKDWLTTTGRLDAEEVAIKTSQRNDLKSPENQDLLSKASRIRVIITQRALQEGWDCPFAYVLCSLASSSNQSAMTQLIGRILRQPHAQKTGINVLDESYVLTHHTETNQVVEAIKNGLEKDGMGDLAQAISIGGAGAGQEGGQTINRNPKFAVQRIFLPKVLRVADGTAGELDYEEDILYPLDWTQLGVDEFVKSIPENHLAAERQLRRIWLDDSSGTKEAKESFIGFPVDQRVFDCAYSTQFISDIIPNPWQARQVVEAVVAGLRGRGFKLKKLGKFSSLINETMRTWLEKEREDMAEELFRAEVKAGRIQFRLRTDGKIGEVNWEMPKQSRTNQPKGASELAGLKGGLLQKSLFLPQYQDDMNAAERNVAVYMDSIEAVNWWHRNISRNHYSLQGWRRDKIYPDFICSVQSSDTGNLKLCVLEMKGEHLAGNRDTKYKQAMLQLLTESFDVKQANRIGEVDLLGVDGTTRVHCDLIQFTEWEQKLPGILT